MHVRISDDAYQRLKKFSKKYKMPMKRVLDWILYSLFDEDGEPQIESFIEVLEEILSDLNHK